MAERRDDSVETGEGAQDDATRLRETSSTTGTWGGSAVKGAATEIGDVLAHTYRLEALLGRGGMGAVYRASHIALGTEHAIKVILPEYAHDPYFVALIEREARALHRVRDEAVVEYQGLFLDEEGRRYLVMEFVAGEPLAAVTRKRALGVDEVRRLKRRLARGLAAAHAQGVFHRDLSPDNVILPGGNVDAAKIIDFGIAKSTDAASGPTLVGSEFAGKYSYVSPEQVGLNGGAVDGRSDIYSLGLVLAAAALGEGRKLKMGDSPVTVVEARKSVPDLSPIPEELRAELRAMLQPRAEDRPQSMTALLAVAAPVQPKRRWVPILVGAAAGAAVLAGVGVFLYPRFVSPPSEAPAAAAKPSPQQQASRPATVPGVEDLIARLRPAPAPEPPAKTAAAEPKSPPAAPPPAPQEPSPQPAATEAVAEPPAAAPSPPPATPAPAASQAPTPPPQPSPAPAPQQATLPAAVPDSRPSAPPPPAAVEPQKPAPPALPVAQEPPAPAPKAATAPIDSRPAPPAPAPPSVPAVASAAPAPAPASPSAATASPPAPPPAEKNAEVASRQEATPPPPKPPALTDADVVAALGDIDCGALTATTGQDRIKLAGVLPSTEDSASVVRKLGLRFPGATVANEALIVGRPFCAPLAALWRAGAVGAAGAPRIALAKQSWRDGEAFAFDVASSASSLVFIDASLVDAEGTVVHLLPTRKNPDASLAPGATKRIGAAHGTGGEIFEVAPPYGANLLLVVAAASPVTAGPRPQVEKLDDYLRVLQHSQAKTRLSAAWAMIETLPK